MTIVAETSAPDAATLAPVLREVVRGIDPNMPVFDARTMQDFYTPARGKDSGHHRRKRGRAWGRWA